MNQDLVGEKVRLSAPARAMAALVRQAVAGLLAGAEAEAPGSDVGDSIERAVAAADLASDCMLDACILLVADGVDVSLAESGQDPVVTVEHRR